MIDFKEMYDAILDNGRTLDISSWEFTTKDDDDITITAKNIKCGNDANGINCLWVEFDNGKEIIFDNLETELVKDIYFSIF